jgi:hypothetical protein
MICFMSLLYDDQQMQCPYLHFSDVFYVIAARKEELRRLRQALKVLSEAEKQLRVSGDRPTWLTAALLQFAPDRSFLSSSVNNSSIPQSPVSFKVQPGKEDNTMGQSLQSRGLVTMDEQVSASRKVETSQQSTGATAVRPLVAMYLEMRRKNRQSGIQAEAKVHPAESSLDYVHHQHKHRSQQQHQVGVSGVPADDVLNASKYSKPLHSNGFWRLHHRNLEDVWNQVLQVIQFSGEMQQLLLHHGNLLAVHVANGRILLLLAMCSLVFVINQTMLYFTKQGRSLQKLSVLWIQKLLTEICADWGFGQMTLMPLPNWSSSSCATK